MSPLFRFQVLNVLNLVLGSSVIGPLVSLADDPAPATVKVMDT